MTAVELHRIDTTQNMRRFYRLDMQPDLFGGVLLVRQWGRIGAEGRSVAEHFDDVALADDALVKQSRRKLARGYFLTITTRL
jgi:predicted DNA-binding WGR domain protein